MKRSPLVWIAMAAVGVVAVIGVAALIGGDDDSEEVVSAGEWADTVCGSIAVWRGEMESIVEDLRTPTANASGTEEPQSETPQGRTGFIRTGIERSISATETMITGIENAGVPDTEQGEEAADAVDEWANEELDNLEEAEESLETESETLGDAIDRLTDAGLAIGAGIKRAVTTLGDVVQTDPQLVAAFRASSTCEELREEESNR